MRSGSDEEAISLWKWFYDISIKEFERVYEKLGVKFDYYTGESFYNDKMDAVVEEFTEMGMWMLAAFIILLDICLFMYDRLLVPMTVLYANKLRPRLRFLIR